MSSSKRQWMSGGGKCIIVVQAGWADQNTERGWTGGGGYTADKASPAMIG